MSPRTGPESSTTRTRTPPRNTSSRELFELMEGHPALPAARLSEHGAPLPRPRRHRRALRRQSRSRSEEHTSELQSHSDLVCRLLLEKKKTTQNKQCQ